MRNYQTYTILDAKAATGSGITIPCDDFTHAIISFHTASSANLTVKFAGSIADTAPDFAAAQSVSNSFDYVQVKDLEDGTAIDGDTGVTLAGTDDNRLFEVNINALKYLNAIVTARAAGSVTVKVRLYNNY
jgi:hypothetical protein